jgi:hypothetical protein
MMAAILAVRQSRKRHRNRLNPLQLTDRELIAETRNIGVMWAIARGLFATKQCQQKSSDCRGASLYSTKDLGFGNDVHFILCRPTSLQFLLQNEGETKCDFIKTVYMQSNTISENEHVNLQAGRISYAQCKQISVNFWTAMTRSLLVGGIASTTGFVISFFHSATLFLAALCKSHHLFHQLSHSRYVDGIYPDNAKVLLNHRPSYW